MEAARPSHCRHCRKPARRGDRIRIQGHGQRQRRLRGPSSPQGPPEFRIATVRRYRCSDCKTTMSVSPRGLAKRYRYSLPAIVTALLLWALHYRPAHEVRAKTSPLPNFGLNQFQRWPSLLRWARCATALFGLSEPIASDSMTHRQAAERIAHLVLATGPPGDSELERIFFAAQIV